MVTDRFNRKGEKVHNCFKVFKQQTRVVSERAGRKRGFLNGIKGIMFVCW